MYFCGKQIYIKMKRKKHFSEANLWPDGPRLSMVNSEQFSRNDLAQKLGWKNLAAPITDPESIKVRQDSLKMFVYSKKLRKISLFLQAPSLSRQFFEDFGSNSSFNKNLADILFNFDKVISSVKTLLSTDTYQNIVSGIKEEHGEIIKLEDNLSELLKKELVGVYGYTGVASFKSNLDYEKTKHKDRSYGVQQYAFHRREPWFIKICRWIVSLYSGEYLDDPTFWKKCLLVLTNIVFLIPAFVAVVVTSLADKFANDALYTQQMPASVKNALLRLHKDILSKVEVKLAERFSTESVKMRGQINEIIFITTQFEFVLDPTVGFIVRLIDLNYKVEISDKNFKNFNSKWSNPFDREEGNFYQGNSLYAAFKRWRFNVESRRMAKDASERALRLPLRFAVDSVISQIQSTLCSDGQNIVDRNEYLAMLEEVKYSQISDALFGLSLESDWLKIKDFRQNVISFLKQVEQVRVLAEKILSTRAEYKEFSICFPQVVSDEKNVVSFGKLWPIDLIGRQNKEQTSTLSKRDIRPVSGLPALNGQMVSVTGQNGGGKTVVEVALINALYIAHMGFPVFAEDFVFNAKDVIAMVFVEKGEGSMLELLMKKLNSVAEAIQENKNNKIVVIIDELLTGTQEDAGFDLGKKYLHMLKKQGCSVLFVTQITQLANYAKTELGARSFYFDGHGNLHEGVGVGNAQKLAEEVGLMKFLE